MPEVPNSLEATIIQAKEATRLALEEGLGRIQVELVIPEIALSAQTIALEFTSLLDSYGEGLKVLFPDSGAAALARRDWGETPFKISDLGSRFTPVEMKITPEDEAFLVVCPSSIEVQSVAKLCDLAGDRPVVILIPQLEDVSIVGIGYTARQLRDNFLSTLQSSYYIRPLDGAVVLRAYPELWQVWLEKEDGYELIAQESQKPMGEALELMIARATGQIAPENPENKEIDKSPKPKKPGLLANMQRFLRALNQ
ncbi:conserved hypothetical protein [Gloeothece citriformis PCC 7424]|uniref:DUF1995 domain-containing protein n=1 Tax=Gloeothece citriformis (strain PCC 7424) TaxID=65393 RepID=B7KHM3_GLOC7|nr:DUF1995 family protein [Gloeothece citriformis]ACK70718.1 conserved hypothetical protein [Gloeothece citriformis PCC 7424]